MSARRLQRACAGLSLLLALGCATPAPVVDVSDWLELRTAGFTVYGNLEPDELRRLTGDLLLFDAVVRKVTNTRIGHSHLPVRLFVVRDPEQAREFMPHFASGVLYPTLDGYDSALIGEDPDSADFWTRHTLLHEYAHYVLRGDRRTPLPRWYDEGLSEFLAYMGVRDDVILIGRAATPRLADLARRGPMPLAELFGLEPGQRVDLGRYYATAWALVHHLNTSKDLNRQSLAYVRRLVRGEDWRSAFDASFEPSLEALEASLAQHIAFLQRGGRRDFHLARSKVAVPAAPEPVEVSPAETAYQLGGLVRRIAEDSPDAPREIDRARQLFRRALELDPAHPRAEAALAWTLAARGRFEEASDALAVSGVEDSGDPDVALDVARVAALRARASGDPLAVSMARQRIERAIGLAPESPQAHAELARLLAATGRHDAAIAAFERARELGGWSARLEVDLAREYLKVGGSEHAIALLRPVARDDHAGEVAEEAQRLLDQAGADPGSGAS